MEITEEHLQRIFEEFEENAIKSGKKGIEYQTIIHTAWSMRTKILVILRAKSEEDYRVSKAHAKEFMRILNENNGDILSYKYKCGHGIVPVVLNTEGIDSMETYMEWWTNNIECICIDCWMKKKRVKKDK